MVLVHVNIFFSKIQPVCHNIVNGIKPGSSSKTTDMLKSCILVLKAICVRCLNCSCNNIIAKGIRLHDKKAIFVYTENILYK